MSILKKIELAILPQFGGGQFANPLECLNRRVEVIKRVVQINQIDLNKFVAVLPRIVAVLVVDVWVRLCAAYHCFKSLVACFKFCDVPLQFCFSNNSHTAP